MSSSKRKEKKEKKFTEDINNAKNISNAGYSSYLNMRSFIILLILILSAVCIVVAFFNIWSFLIVIPIVLVCDICGIFMSLNYKREQKVLIKRLLNEIGSGRRDNFCKFPIPVLACSVDGVILWYNECFEENVIDGKEFIGTKFSDISKEPLNDFCSRIGVQVSFNNKDFRVHATYSNESAIYILYFEDNTNLIFLAKEYQLSRPSLIYIMIDNYDDVFEGKKESEKSTIIGKIDQIIEDFVGESTGFMQRLSRDKFLIVMEQRHLDNVVKEKFKILDEVRELLPHERNILTLSVGVGSNAETLYESQLYAHKALDMALGRGGDQVALKTSTGFDFYGGMSKDVEKRTRVKARVVANALRELIDESKNVIIMGHKFGDLDSIGSAVGLASAVRKLGKESFIAIDPTKNLAKELLERLKDAGFYDMILHPKDAVDKISSNTLLIIVDTHNPDFLESDEIYKRCKMVVVIDHHRKMVNHIENAVIFYHEPYASSASELVCELIQYFGDDCILGSIEAEAMLSGIMLDTKNFVIKAGVRTFEAAAYLKRLGADTVSVRKLFSNTIDSYQRRTRIVSGSEIYRNCAIAVSDFQTEDMRVISPQAADELLGITGVDASFVIYQINGTSNITARSLGNINAQVIMERLGGGGHQTQAACQLKDTSVENARQMLLEAIDDALD